MQNNAASKSTNYYPILATLISVAFAAWAGVIVWFGNAINERLYMLQDSMERIEGEMVEFKIGVVERVTRVEAHVENQNR